MKTKSAIIFFFALLLLNIAQGQRAHNFTTLVETSFYNEGVISLPVSSSLELVSFYASLENYKKNKGQDLSIELFAPEASYFLIKAEEKKKFSNYWMESKPDTLKKGKNTFGPWSVDRILASKNVSPNNLGILARFQTDDSKHLLPIFIYHTTRPEKLTHYKASFRIGKTIYSGRYKIYKGEYAGVLPDSAVQSGVVGINLAGATFDIYIKSSNLENYEGWVTVNLTLEPKGSSVKLPFRFYFYHTSNLK